MISALAASHISHAYIVIRFHFKEVRLAGLIKSNSYISVDTKDFENPPTVSMVYSTVSKVS